jgi:DNA-binding NtrC family response regulator
MAQKLLLIEENRQLLDLVAGFLSNLGYEVHSAREYDEAHALLTNYHYKAIISGEEPTSFGTPEDNLAKYIDSMALKPYVIRLHDGAPEPPNAPSSVDPSMVYLEKPISLLKLGDLMRKIISN